MAKRAVLITHDDQPMDDRVSARLAALGYNLDWRKPFAGEPLGVPDSDVAVTVLFGGSDPHDVCDWHTDRYPFIAAETAWVTACMAQNIPTLGLCLGGCIISHALGAAIGPPDHGRHEFGYYPLSVTAEGRTVMPDGLVVAEAHYHGFDLPHGASRLAYSADYPNQAYRYGDRTYAFQFHPEVSRAGFRRWQESDWAPWGRPGVQPRDLQDALADEHDAAQVAWIDGFINKFMA